MSASIQDNIYRWNELKWETDDAAFAVIRATQFIVRPIEDFPACKLGSIRQLWDEWCRREEIFWDMTTADKRPARIFPEMPDVIAEECCFRMWALTIQVQVDVNGAQGYTKYLRETVAQIAANEKCKAHPMSCSCKVQKHPWRYKQEMDILAPLNPAHSLQCRCAGWRCALTPATQILASCHCGAEPCTCFAARRADYDANTSAAIFMNKVEALKKEHSTYDYTHHVETCPCGTCHKARVDSGTDGAYSKMCQEVNKPK